MFHVVSIIRYRMEYLGFFDGNIMEYHGLHSLFAKSLPRWEAWQVALRPYQVLDSKVILLWVSFSFGLSPLFQDVSGFCEKWGRIKTHTIGCPEYETIHCGGSTILTHSSSVYTLFKANLR